jgi:hypothetical protein
MKRIIIATVIVLGASSAALAQGPSFAALHSSGLDAFAMVPHTRASSIDNPALTGGGSLGYNDLVRSNDW